MIKKSLYVACAASILNASATMCYKKEHLDPSTIENIALSGGECKDTYSVNDMKKNGYVVDSMKIQNGTNGFNYIYVFQKDKAQDFKLSTNANLTDEQLLKRLEKIQTKQIEIKKEEKRITNMAKGKNIYDSTCKRCHGDGTKRAYNTARALKSMTLEQMQVSIRDIANGEQDNGMGILMMPYANLLSSQDLKDVYNYLNRTK